MTTMTKNDGHLVAALFVVFGTLLFAWGRAAPVSLTCPQPKVYVMGGAQVAHRPSIQTINSLLEGAIPHEARP